MEQKTKLWLTIGITFVVVGVVIWGLFTQKPIEVSVPQPDRTLVLPPPDQITGQLPNQTPSAIVLPTDTLHIITYADAGFSPKTITIKKGEKVTFQNNSSLGFWPASGKHPTHELYPEKGGCFSSKFDSCAEYQPGKSWSFQFNIAGTWTYHDHLAPSKTGTIIVTP